jgi:trimethylguanosine synthase
MKCIAVDNDEQKVMHCLHNAEIYNCKDNIRGITTDFLNIKPSDIPEFVAEEKKAIFLSPNWGGHVYNEIQSYSVDCVFPPIRETMKCLKLSQNIILYLPRNSDIKELVEMIAKMYSKYTD